MNTFYCTKKLQQAFRLTPTRATHSPTARLGNWYLNTIRIDRRAAILFTNERTLFSFVMLKGSARSIDKLRWAFMRGLMVSLGREGIDNKNIDDLVNEYADEPAIGAATDRRVLGTMNQIALDIDHIVYYDGGLDACDLGEAIHRINRVPWQATGFVHASKLVIQTIQNRSQ